MFSKTLIACTLAAAASAHQNFHQFWVNGVSPGYQVGIRMPPSNNPVVSLIFTIPFFPCSWPPFLSPPPPRLNLFLQTDVTSNDITCNVNGNAVPTTVKTVAAKAGDRIEVQWDASTHPGPITHFLYGPVADASKATGLGTWYKINELDYANGKWANEVMEAAGMTYNFTLPAKLASGDYLVRFECVAHFLSRCHWLTWGTA